MNSPEIINYSKNEKLQRKLTNRILLNGNVDVHVQVLDRILPNQIDERFAEYKILLFFEFNFF